MEELLGEETIRRLIISLKTPKKWRAMDPIEIAQNLKILCEHFPQHEVARRLGISKKGTLWVYLRLVNLPEKVQQLIRSGKIGQDTGYRISILKDPKEQEILADAVIKYRLSSDEVKGIVQNLKKRNPELPIEECIRLAVKARPSITEEHIVVTKIGTDTLESLKKKSQAEGVKVEELLRKYLLEFLSPQSVNSLKLFNRTVIMSLGKEDFRLFRNKAQEIKVKLENLIDTLVKRGLTS